jgi:aspartyl-tRNA(Asn)/glutamyl-tRNA(Gln) amidotransferase subunit A
MKIKEFVEGVKSGKVDVVAHTKDALNEIGFIDNQFHFFNVIGDEGVISQAESINKNGRMAGVVVSVKDCICVKGMESRAGSKMLSGYNPVFDATVISKLRAEGAIIVGKTAQDAFGFGSFSVNVGLGMKVPLNPFDKERSCGGSSGGSGGITQKASFPHISIGESTGGSIEAPASFCGVIGFCPTYGRVSRYGLIDYANSFDKIGPMSKSMEDIALTLEVIAGYDVLDSTSLNVPVEKYTSFVGKSVKGMKVGLVKESIGDGVDPSVKASILEAVSKLKSQGAEVEEVSLPLTFKYGVSAYYLLAMCEASTNLSKLCGMRYGAHAKLEGGFNEYFSSVRSSNFNKESKRRIIIGTFARMSGFRDAYYIKAAKVRSLIIEEYKSLFKKYDCLISPVTPTVAPRFEDIKKMTPLQNYMADIMTVGPNLAGIPHASVPVGFVSGMPVGLQIMSDHLNEGKVIQLGSVFEDEE